MSEQLNEEFTWEDEPVDTQVHARGWLAFFASWALGATAAVLAISQAPLLAAPLCVVLIGAAALAWLKGQESALWLLGSISPGLFCAAIVCALAGIGAH